MKKTKMQKGITLVALIITIIVLLILAMVAIRAVTGDGIIKHAQRARDEYNRTSQEENGIISGYEDYINSQLGGSSGGATGGNEETSYNGMYNMPGLEGKIAPADLFDYEPIEGTGQTAALDNSSLPQKEIKITRIKPEYCNGGGYNPDSGVCDFADTNYEIIYKGEKLPDDILVIPYQVEYEGELYKVTQVCLEPQGAIGGESRGSGCPKVDTIVFPNIASFSVYWGDDDYGGNTRIKRIVLPDTYTELKKVAFANKEALESITLPKTLKIIGEGVFYNCKKLVEIKFLGTMEEWEAIEKNPVWSEAPVERIVCSDGTITL